MEVPPIPEGVSVSLPKKLGIFHRIIILLCSFILSYYTVLVFGSGLHLGWGIFAYVFFVAPALWAVVSIFYFYLLKKIYNPKLVSVGVIFLIINISFLYYFKFSTAAPYSAQITTENSYQIGDPITLTLTPDNGDEKYHNSIKIPLRVHLPDGSTLAGTFTIVPLTTNCSQFLSFVSCLAVPQKFSFIPGPEMSSGVYRSPHILTQAGHYTVDSSSSNIQGASFDVTVNKDAAVNSIVDDAMLMPDSIDGYQKSQPTTSGTLTTVDTTFSYGSSNNPNEPYMLIGISRYKTSEPTVTDLANFQNTVQNQSGNFTLSYRTINNQKIAYTTIGTLNRNYQSYNAPFAFWSSGNRIVSLISHNDARDIDPLMTHFLEIMLKNYPSSL